MKPRTVLLTVVALASVPVMFVGGCLILAIGAGVANYQDDVADRKIAAADSRFQRPLESTSGRILFIAQKDGTDDFHVVNGDGSGLTQLTHLPKGSITTRPIVSPDRTRMVINTGGGVSILSLDRPGEPVRLDRHAGSLAWSPDGKQLASLSIDAGKRLHLYPFNTDGSGEVRDIAAQWPSTADGDEQSAADLLWSPDGKRLAFVLDTRPAYKRFGPRHRHLYITPADGSGLRNVSMDPKAVLVHGNLAWSPDGRRLAFASKNGIGLLDADMNWSEIPIAIHESRSAQQPAWSPDGTRLAWFSPDSIVVSDLTGGNQRELTRGRCRGVNPAWSGDGSRITFVCPHNTGGDLWVMNADGSGLTRLTNFGDGHVGIQSRRARPSEPCSMAAVIVTAEPTVTRNTVRGLAVLVILTSVTACGQAAAPNQSARAPAATAPTSPPPAEITAPASASSSSPLKDLASALGLSAGASAAADGLIPGGDCPAPTGDVASEIEAQAKAAVPLKVGLTLSYSWMRTPQEEYECLIHVTKIEPAFIETSLSCNHPERGGPFVRRVCRSDLRSARLLHTVYGVVKVIGPSGEEEPETIVGATAFSLSSAEFARMKRSGTMAQHYVELGPSGDLYKNGVGELRVDGRETMRVIINDQPLDVPVIKATGKLAWTIGGQSLETEDTAVILDDEQFPLFIDQRSTAASTASRIQFSKITYPSEGGTSSIESGLLENRRVDVYGIYFDFNSDRIRKESEPVLNEIGSIMKTYPDWRLRIAGHTDNVGGDSEYNLQLSRRRSEAVRRALVERFGIAADRLSSTGYGAGAPIDANDTSAGRARNRRVELVRQ